jgi:hypothetical protein
MKKLTKNYNQDTESIVNELLEKYINLTKHEDEEN